MPEHKRYSTTLLLTTEEPQIYNTSEDILETILFMPARVGQNMGGLRTKGYFKASYPGKPLISIITVIFNGEQYLEETIQSIINQTYDNVEYIVIDGGSTDGTLNIIKKYEDQIDYWISEKDNGIYDAMNKGISLATGDWINFMNAGDRFFNDNILKQVFSTANLKDLGVIYGDHEVRFPKKKRISNAGSIDILWKGSQFSHQSAFISTSLHKKNKYNTCTRIAADFEFFYTIYLQNIKFHYVDLVISSISSGGLSDTKRINSILEVWNIIEKNSTTNFYYVFLILQEILKDKVKKLLNISKE